MNVTTRLIKQKVEALLEEGDNLLQALEAFGWQDSRSPRTTELTEAEANEISTWFERTIPETALIPSAFIYQYHTWYAGCLAITEVSMPSRLKQLTNAHENMLGFLKTEYITFSQQVAGAHHITQIRGIIGSVPQYVDARLHDLELMVAQAYVGDQLNEAQALLKAGYIRAAGAIAGVLLERHLKLLCDRHNPALKYPTTAAIAKLNDLLKDAGVYDVAQWRKVQWMADIRNSCDHARTAEPNQSDVQYLVSEVRKFVALFVA
jgi:hypothetical protein